MFRYHIRIREKYGRPVLSLGVLTDEVDSFRPGIYMEAIGRQRLIFEYSTVRLLDYEEHREMLETSANPFSMVILAHLDARKARSDVERFHIRFALTKRLYTRGFHRQDILQLYRFLNWILLLPKDAEVAFWRRVNTEIRGVRDMEFLASFELEAREKGREEGKLEGKAEGKAEGEGGREGKVVEKVQNDKNGFTLYLRDLKLDKTIEIPFVKGYWLADKREALLYFTTGVDSVREPGLWLRDLSSGNETPVFKGKDEIKGVTMNSDATQIAFYKKDSVDQSLKSFIYLWSPDAEAAVPVVSPEDAFLPDGWEISENGRLSFSDSNKRLFFGIAPKPLEKDSSKLDEDIPNVDIWHWNEPVLYTQQLNSRSRDQRKTYMAVYHRDLNKSVQIETEDLSGLRLVNSGDGNTAVAWSNLPYAVQTMWEGSPEHNDWYLIDLVNGKRERIKSDIRATPQVSTGGKYLYWYQALDSTWHTRNLETGAEFTISTPDVILAADEINDIPNPPGSYGSPGWLKNDEALLIYDRFDVWKVHPENQHPPVNLTMKGREQQITYRMINLEGAGNRFRGGADEGIDSEKTLYLSGHNEASRCEGFYTGSFKKPATPKALLSGQWSLGSPLKAEEADVVVFTKENFETFPDLLVSDLKFKKETRISNANPQQKDFIWGTAELVSWTSLDGRKLEGTLHKPENFDASKKYPMIVNFYEKSSQELFSYRTPEPHRSTIDYHYYTSNGYLVFNPDIYYKEGYPGEDAYNCVMPGVTSLIEKGFVDEKAIGAQGHSWGGYQVAYLATRTNLFAAIESGAPVVNMFSAYGGIRWGSGLNRSFQYEHTQSRIGKSIWEAPLRYLENSPLFTMDKVNTPILIMHNDDDVAVPWYQGIEYFIALRRLGKPAWLLNYNDADHWPTKMQDKQDFQIRLAQFFNHYLKGAPMPEWMEKGLPAVEKGLKLGY